MITNESERENMVQFIVEILLEMKTYNKLTKSKMTSQHIEHNDTKESWEHKHRFRHIFSK